MFLHNNCAVADEAVDTVEEFREGTGAVAFLISSLKSY